MGLIVAASVTLVAVAFGVFNSLLISMYNAKGEAMAPELRQLRIIEADVRAIRLENREYEQQIAEAKGFIARESNLTLVETLRGIAEVTPRGVWLNQLFFSPGGKISANGYASTSEDLSSLLGALKGMPGVVAVELPSLRAVDQGAGVQVQVFTLHVSRGGEQP